MSRSIHRVESGLEILKPARWKFPFNECGLCPPVFGFMPKGEEQWVGRAEQAWLVGVSPLVFVHLLCGHGNLAGEAHGQGWWCCLLPLHALLAEPGLWKTGIISPAYCHHWKVRGWPSQPPSICQSHPSPRGRKTLPDQSHQLCLERVKGLSTSTSISLPLQWHKANQKIDLEEIPVNDFTLPLDQQQQKFF